MNALPEVPRQIVQPLGFYPRKTCGPRVWKYAEQIRAIVRKLIVGSIHTRDGWVPLAHEDASALVGDGRAWDRIRSA